MLRTHMTHCAKALEDADGISWASIGKRALNDNTFFARLQQGGGFTIRTYDRLMQWFSDNWPEGAVWPADVPRPSPSQPVPREAAE